jgi:hypothetical protein
MNEGRPGGRSNLMFFSVFSNEKGAPNLGAPLLMIVLRLTLQERQHALLRGICLGQHGHRSLLKNLRLGHLRAF